LCGKVRDANLQSDGRAKKGLLHVSSLLSMPPEAMHPTLTKSQAERPADQFTFNVIQEAVAAAADEMFAVLRKTAMSPIIYEVLDFGAGVTDPVGNLLSSGAGIPGFVGAIDKAVKRLIELAPSADAAAGDIFVTNDPYAGGVTHLNDVVLLMPVFAGGELLAWVGNMAHWNDVGGAVPGSMPVNARDIHAEGLRLPLVKLFVRGKLIEPVVKIMTANSRLPDFLLGDLWAGVASMRKGAERIERLATTYGRDAFTRAIRDYQDYAERQARQGLAKLPKGRLALEETIDDGAIWRAAIDITEDAFVVDLRNAPEQRQDPLNTSRDGAVIAAQLIFKAATAPQSVCNAGSFRPLRVLTRPGTIFDPREPAAQGYYFEVRARLTDMLWHGLAKAATDRFPAGHFGSICGTVVAGRHPRTGRRYTMVEPQVGGWGATSTRDGANAQFSAGHGDTFNCPIEVAEARYGFAYRRLALNDEPGGEGRHCGGLGIIKEFAVGGEETEMSIGYSRHRQRVWGLAGGAPGTTNRVEIDRHAGGRETHALVSGLPLAKGDVVRIVTARGGGWGETTAKS
jgi:N-methylhydantoinase B